ncbi:hypothetical protein J4463_03290 [Candidatus Pacearchaeota archaeon]|nr:hypothetical protein [Candidatus Pacearchaeota archaeon]
MKSKLARGLAGLLVAGSMIFPFAQKASAQEQKPESTFIQRLEDQIVLDKRESPGFVKSKAYWVFGSKYYLPQMGYPIANWKFDYQQLTGHDIPIKSGSEKCDSADSNGWTPVPIGDRNYFRAEYHLKDLDIPLNEWVDELLKYYHDKGIKKSYTEEEKSFVSERSKVHLALFPASEFELGFHPGSYLLIHENGDQESAKCSPRKGVEVKERYTKILPEERDTLIGLFNGTFWNQDTIRQVNGNSRRAGLIIDGETIDEPISGLASVAFYDDGRFRLGLFEEMPDRERIRLMRQNEVLLLHNGEVQERGAYPRMWISFNDEVLVSYLVTSRDNDYFGYAWTTHCPQSVFAKLMQRLNFEEAMMVDIHPVINSVLASPRKEEREKFSKENSYAFVPIEEEVVNTLVRALAMKVKGPIQYNPYTPLYFSEKDFFSVSLK